jgi:hypothetical protein
LHIIEQENAERAEKVRKAEKVRTERAAQDLRGQLAEVDRQIAAIKGELDQHVDDDPSLWPLRKKLVTLHYTRRELLDQLKGGR